MSVYLTTRFLSLLLVFCGLQVQRIDGFSREASVSKGGAIVEPLGEVAIPEAVVKVSMDISKIEMLPKCLTDLKGALVSIKSKIILGSTSIVKIENAAVSLAHEFHWATGRSIKFISTMESQLPFNASEVFSQKDPETIKIFNGQTINSIEKSVDITHSDLLNFVTQTCELSTNIHNCVKRSNDNVYYNDMLQVLDKIYIWQDDIQLFFSDFMIGLRATNTGQVLPSLFPEKEYREVMEQTLLKWQFEPIANPQEEIDLYYKLLDGYYLEGLVIITIPLKKAPPSIPYFASSKVIKRSPRGKSYNLSRILAFPITLKDSFLIIHLNHDIILTSEDKFYSHSSKDDLKYCKKPFPAQNYYLCPYHLFKFHDQSLFSSCESDIFFKENTELSCTYSQLENVPKTHSLRVGYTGTGNYYLYFPYEQGLRVICYSTTENIYYYSVHGYYIMNSSCRFEQLDYVMNFFNSYIHEGPLTNITDQLAIPSNWDFTVMYVEAKEETFVSSTEETFVSSTEETFVSAKEETFDNVTVAQVIIIIMNVSIIVWLCVFVRECRPRTPWTLIRSKHSKNDTAVVMSELSTGSVLEASKDPNVTDETENAAANEQNCVLGVPDDVTIEKQDVASKNLGTSSKLSDSTGPDTSKQLKVRGKRITAETELGASTSVKGQSDRKQFAI